MFSNISRSISIRSPILLGKGASAVSYLYLAVLESLLEVVLIVLRPGGGLLPLLPGLHLMGPGGHVVAKAPRGSGPEVAVYLVRGEGHRQESPGVVEAIAAGRSERGRGLELCHQSGATPHHLVHLQQRRGVATGKALVQLAPCGENLPDGGGMGSNQAPLPLDHRAPCASHPAVGKPGLVFGGVHLFSGRLTKPQRVS